MKEIYPSVYKQFQCTASACRHNCCIGWEIDIDPDTLERYRALPGELGRRIENAIMQDDCPHFRQDDSGRCRMLDTDNLCAIQRTLCESALCSICRDHPRYRVFLPGRTEIGLGLCCEEAARLWLRERTRITMPFDPASESAQTAALLIARQKLLDIVYDRALSLGGRMRKLLFVSGGHISKRSPSKWAAFLRDLEPLEDEWRDAIAYLSKPTDEAAFHACLGEREREYENLLVYFLLRHFLADGGQETGTRAAFAVFSVNMLYHIGAAKFAEKGHFDEAEQIELARLWSANVEYSESNMQRIFHELTL